MEENKLTVAPSNTEAVIIKGPTNRNEINLIMNGTQITPLKRKSLLRVVCAHRTIPAEAICVITRVTPIEINGKKRCRLHTNPQPKQIARQEERLPSKEQWQQRWDTAQWTKRPIPTLEPWLSSNLVDTNYLLTGHGFFMSCIKKIDKTDNDNCDYCGAIDKPEHTIFKCER
ncbi:hypothetical protein JTB14_036674 [Gonioctena quinquepunctata]|nr:hypothetical protein JTB14_036674 [Gonioctena quinquepunctata]